MKLVEKAVDQPRPVILAAIVLAALGIYSFLNMPQELTPEITVPVCLVSVPYPNASPEEVETEVSREVEEALSTLEDVDVITTISSEGASIAIIEFFDTAPVKERVRDVQDKIDVARSEFPEDADEPIVEEIRYSDIPIVMVTLSGEVSPERLRDVAEELEPILEGVDGVRRVSLFGGIEPEMQVTLDDRALRAYQLSPTDVVTAVADENRNIPGGKIETAKADFLLRTRGRYEDAREIESTIVADREAGPIYLRQLGSAAMGHADLKSTSRILTPGMTEGKDAVTLQVAPSPGIDILRTVGRVKEAVGDYLENTGDPIEVTYINDETVELTRMKNNLGTNLWQGGVLVVISLLLTMGFRNAMLVGLAIPVSLVVGCLFMFIADVTLTGIAIFSVILVLGIVVDGALIVGENIYRHLEEGLSGKEAAKKGIREVAVPVLAADLTTISAYLPMLLVTGVVGSFLGTIPKVVTFAIIGSIFVDHLLLPVLAQWWMRGHKKKKTANTPLEEESAEKDGEPEPGHDPISIPVQEPEKQPEHPGFSERFIFHPLRQPYLNLLKRCLKHPFITLGVNGLLFAVALGLIGSKTLGFEFFPETDIGRFQIEFENETGTPLSRTDEVAQRLEQLLADHPELRYAVSTTGESGAFDAEFRFGSGSGPEFGKIFVEMTPPEKREQSLSEIIDELKSEFGELPGVDVVFRQREEGPPTGTDIAIRVSGDNLEQIKSFSQIVADQLASIDGTDSIRNDFRVGRPQVIVEVNRDLAGLYGVRTQDVGLAVQAAFAGISPNDYYDEDEEVELRVKYDEDRARTIEALEDTLVRARKDGEEILIPVKQVSDISLESGLSTIYRRNQQRTATVRCDALEGYSVDQIHAELKEKLEGEKGLGIPTGLSIEYGGESEERDKAMNGLVFSFALALLLILSILVIQFDSFLLPFLVMLTIPLSLVGVVLGLFICNIPFGFMPMIAIVSLSGIVVNDSIVLVSFLNNLRKDGMPVGEAIQQACRLRFRPVVLTTVTTIFGILPLTLNLTGGGEFWVPLGVSMIFGIATASALTLLVVPVMYSLLFRGELKQEEKETVDPPLEIEPAGA